jgi:hypothetical protein
VKCQVVEIYRKLLLMEGVLLLAGTLMGQSPGLKSDMTLKLRPFVTLRSEMKWRKMVVAVRDNKTFSHVVNFCLAHN